MSKSNSKLPFFMFYPSDWRNDVAVQSLDLEIRMIWFEMLCLMHMSDERGRLVCNGIPMPDKVLAETLKTDVEKVRLAKNILLDFAIASLDEDGVLYSRRMVREEQERLELQAKRALAGSAGGKQKARNSRKTKDFGPDGSKPVANSSKPVANGKQTDSNALAKSSYTYTYTETELRERDSARARRDGFDPVADLIDAFPHVADRLTPAQIGMIETEIKDPVAFKATLERYVGNFNPQLNQYRPEKISNLIGVYREELAKQETNNATGNRVTAGNGSGKRSTAEILDGYERLFAKYDANADADADDKAVN